VVYESTMSVEEENAKFKELVKQGYSVRRA
jgi:hypothetical protein